jgi:ABC-2 type transport system ATP-binding protein
MSGLDPVGRREIRELIAELAKDGKTIIFSSHILSDVEEICDDLVAIKKGELAYSGPMSALFEKSIEGYRITTSEFKLETKTLEEAQKKIQELQRSNHKIIEFKPIRKSMEALFFT